MMIKRRQSVTGYGFPGLSVFWNPNKSTQENLKDAEYFARFAIDTNKPKIIWPPRPSPESEARQQAAKEAALARIAALKENPTPTMLIREQVKAEKKQRQAAAPKAPATELSFNSMLRLVKVPVDVKPRILEMYQACFKAYKNKPFRMGDARKLTGWPPKYIFEKLIPLGCVEVVKL